MATAEEGAIQTIKELAEAVSTQAQVTNRTWLGLLTVSVLALLPRAPSAETPTVPFLPIGPVDASWYHVILFAMLVVLTIAFAAAQAQTVRSLELAQAFLDSAAIRSSEVAGMRPRELFDMMRLPNLNRVASLAQSLRGRYQFYRGEPNCPRGLRIASTVYYALLRVASWVVYYGIPGGALWQAYTRTHFVGFLWWLLTVGGSLSVFTLVQLFVIDLKHSIKVVQIIGSGTPHQHHAGKLKQK